MIFLDTSFKYFCSKLKRWLLLILYYLKNFKKNFVILLLLFLLKKFNIYINTAIINKLIINVCTNLKIKVFARRIWNNK